MPPLAMKLTFLNSDFGNSEFRIRTKPTWGTYLPGSARFGTRRDRGLRILLLLTIYINSFQLFDNTPYYK
jgi:hypothetical protein